MNFITPNIQLRIARWVKDPSREVHDDDGKAHHPWKLGPIRPVVAVHVAPEEDHPTERVVLLCDVLGYMHDAVMSAMPDEPAATLGYDDFDAPGPVRVEWFDPEIGQWRPLP